MFGGVSRRSIEVIEYLVEIKCRIVLRVLGVEYGRRLRLHGTPIISIRPGSKFSIGNDCRLRSSSHGNAIGVNHPVVLRTMGQDAILSIGDRFGMSGGSICAVGSVIIGSRVLIGANVVISDSDFHSLDAFPPRQNSCRVDRTGGFKSEVQHPRYQWIVAPVFSAATCINSLKTWIGVRQSRVSRGRLLSRSAMESRAS